MRSVRFVLFESSAFGDYLCIESNFYFFCVICRQRSCMHRVSAAARDVYKRRAEGREIFFYSDFLFGTPFVLITPPSQTILGERGGGVIAAESHG